MKLLTSVFVLLFSLGVVVGQIHAQDENNAIATSVVVQSLIPTTPTDDSFCRYYIDYDSGLILQTSCPIVLVTSVAARPNDMYDATFDSVVSALQSSAQIQVFNAASALATRYHDLNPAAVVSDHVRVNIVNDTRVNGPAAKGMSWEEARALIDVPPEVSLNVIPGHGYALTTYTFTADRLREE